MKKYPHPRIPGPLQFVTVIVTKQLPLFRSVFLCREFFRAMAGVKASFPFELYAYVLLPDHFHLLFRPPDGDVSRVLQKVKSLAARRVIDRLKSQGAMKVLGALRKPHPGRREHVYKVFQDSFRTLPLWSPWMIKQKIDYIHKNPINERLAENPAAYPWSSWRAIYERSGEPVPVDPLPL